MGLFDGLSQWRAARTARKKSARFYGRFVGPGDLCFDVGANIGNRTRAFLDLGASVVAIEPQQGCMATLKSSFGSNPNVVLLQAALGAEEGFADLSICDDAPTISTMATHWKTEGRFSKDYKWTRTERVPVTTLDALIVRHGQPAFVKIDVEGYEKTVLAGLSKPVRWLSFEFTREFLADAIECLRLLEKIAPITVNASLGESAELAWNDWPSAGESIERLGSTPDPLLWGDLYVQASLPSG